MKATITNLHEEKERVTLPAPIWEGDVTWGTGVTLQGLYKGARSHRRIIETYSIWENRETHGVIGTVYFEANDQEWIMACDRANITPELDSEPEPL